MKKALFTLLISITSSVCYAIGYGIYSLPHTTSESELQKYIGQHVKMFICDGVNSHSFIERGDGHDECVFRDIFKGNIDVDYIIRNIRVSKQIELTLEDENGKTIKAKVNINHESNRKGMQTCESFFLVDKFENDKLQIKGSEIKNDEGKPVAKIEDFLMVSISMKYPEPRLLVKSNFDNSNVLCTKEEAKMICSNFGKIITSPKIKTRYKVIGIVASEEIPYNEPSPIYIVQDISNPKNTRIGTIISPEETIFKKDFQGHYVTVLSEVERPSNPSVKYGKTTIVNEDNMSKYHYVDNVIDITIFGESKQFYFVLKNVSNYSIKVIWNDAVFVNYDGTTSKITHSGIKYSQREADQPASIIIKNAKIEDVAVPNCNIYYSNVKNEWNIKSMYPSSPHVQPGKLRLMIPIQIMDIVNEYVFVFDVKYVYDNPEVLID